MHNQIIESLLEDFKNHVSSKEYQEKCFNFLTTIDKMYYIGGVNEALIHTYNPNKIRKFIEEEFKLENWQYRIVNVDNNINGINIVVLPDDIHIKKLKEILNSRFGWYFTNSFTWQHPESKKTYLVLSFRPKFSNNEIIQKEIEKNPFLWHVTTLDNYKKIIKRGFIPKSKNNLFEYPGKIHFLLGSFSINDAITCYNRLYKISKDKDKDWVILKVDVRKKNGEIPTFYWDPDYEGGLYTYENIPADKIKVMQTIESKRILSESKLKSNIRRELSKLDKASIITYKDLMNNTE